MLTGDLPGPDGSSAAFEVSRLSTLYAAGIVERLHRNEAYRRLRTLISPDVLDAYYVRVIFDRIRPAVTAFCVAEYGRPGAQEANRAQIYLDDPLLCPLLREVWAAPGYEVLGPKEQSSKVSLSRVKRFARNVWNQTGSPFGTTRRHGAISGTPCRIAVEAGEGVDETKRSDLFWLHGSETDRSRLLYYFTHQYEYLKPIEWTKRELDRRGIPWVALGWGAAGRWVVPWSPGCVPAWTTKTFFESVRGCDLGDPWNAFVVVTARELLPEVDYWRAFFRAHQVKVQFSISPAHLMGMAKRMALDLEGGIQIGTQRNFISPDWDTHGRRPQHVFFTWGNPQYAFDAEAFNCGKTLLVSGFVYGATSSSILGQTEELRARLKAAGARFIIALFDNAFGDFHITRAMTVRFYRAFLRWLLDHGDAGLVIKPKKPRLFGELRETRDLLARAKDTGRCVELSGALGKFPGEASGCADLSVGIFLGTAVIEAAVNGHRGVHCDLSRLSRHPFYRWGREKVVFDDERKLIEAITRYMHDPAGEPDLGDHSPILAELDPFRDGQAGRRVGEYMRWLLDAFDAGLDRDGAIAFANERYAGAWGSDKVIRLVDRQVGGEGGLSQGRFDRCGGVTV
jgi:hypothetical protein